jgi:hypothetical protein
MNNKFKVILSIVLLGLIILLYQNNQLKKDLETLKASDATQLEIIENKEIEINEIASKYEEVIKANEILENELEILNNKFEDTKIIDDITRIKLEDKGVKDYKIIEEDLLSKPELISIEGVLGGTMFFTDVYLLNDQWVYATFEDGHIMASGLYTFEILSSGKIQWEEIKATSD